MTPTYAMAQAGRLFFRGFDRAWRLTPDASQPSSFFRLRLDDFDGDVAEAVKPMIIGEERIAA
jgi:hypothetical protein